MSKIIWKGKRELKKFNDKDIKEYYKELTNQWNYLSDFFDEPTDKRTNYYYAYTNFFNSLLYFWDMIIQTEDFNKNNLNSLRNEISRLRKQLEKWTNNQKGRKSKITEEIKKYIFKLKEDGLSNRAIGRKIGLSETTIRRVLKSEQKKENS